MAHKKSVKFDISVQTIILNVNMEFSFCTDILNVILVHTFD